MISYVDFPSPLSPMSSSQILWESEPFIIFYKPSTSMADVKKALNDYLASLQKVLNTYKNESLQTIKQLSEDLQRWLDKDLENFSPLAALEEWTERAKIAQEKEESLAVLDFPLLEIQRNGES